jgi:hypothetical protein
MEQDERDAATADGMLQLDCKDDNLRTRSWTAPRRGGQEELLPDSFSTTQGHFRRSCAHQLASHEYGSPYYGMLSPTQGRRRLRVDAIDELFNNKQSDEAKAARAAQAQLWKYCARTNDLATTCKSISAVVTWLPEGH